MKKIKLQLAAISVAAIIVTFFSQETLAYYSTVGTATNVVTSGKIQLIIHETTGDGEPFPKDGIYVLPGQLISKRVTVENDCNHPFYLRVKLINSVDSKELSAEECFDIKLNDSAWTRRDDGYIYYNSVLNPNEISKPVFTEVRIVGDKVDNDYLGKTLSLTVNAYAVQEKNNPAHNPWDAVGWPSEEASGQ